MTTPLLELEGTWEEIVAQIPDFSGQKLRVLVYPATGNSVEAPDTRPIAEVLAEIAVAIPAGELAQLPSDFTDQLDHYISAPLSNEASLCRHAILGGQYHAGRSMVCSHVASGCSSGACVSCHDRGSAGGIPLCLRWTRRISTSSSSEDRPAILGNVHVTVLPQTHESFMQGLDFYASRADRAYSLVDCISMNTMRQMELTEVLTNDHHFTQEGFTIS